MIEKSLLCLDFPKLLDIVKEYAGTSKGKERVSLLRPLRDPQEIRERLQKTAILCETIRLLGRVSFEDVSPIRDTLRKLSKEHSVLEPEEFLGLLSFMDICHGVMEYFKKAKRKGAQPLPSEELESVSHLYPRIRRVISPEGSIEDSASLQLARLRSELAKLKEKVKRRLEEIMDREGIRDVVQDFYITVRNGRYVIPVKPNFNQFFQAIVHDHSMSLKTSFVEPMEVVEWNNAINVLSSEIAEEERRILAELTDLLRAESGKLEKNLQVLEEIDFLQALALFAIEFDCVMPEVKEGGALRIRSAMNPFIRLSKGDKSVPIDIILEEGKRAMIISGPNAGGKTVALKTIGLLTVMALSGLLIPAKGRPEIPFFSYVFAVIGDDQDIMSDLSAFTSHMGTIRDIYEACQGTELVLIDEIGGSTDPQEASALACALIDSFVEKGCRIVVTTHSNLLKAYGASHNFAINVATAFDRERFAPLYFLEYGEVGLSNAIETARRIGISGKIIEKAQEYLGKSESLLSNLILGLKEEKGRLEEEVRKLQRVQHELKSKVEQIRAKKDEILTLFRERFEKRLRDLEAELAEARREISKGEKSSLSKAQQSIQALKSKILNAQMRNEKIAPGDLVRIKLLDKRQGHILEEDDDSYIVMVEGLKKRVRKDLVEKVEEESNKETSRVFIDQIGSDLNIRGMRVEEAIEEVDRFVDRAIALGLDTVRILHGIGTGRLMNAIRDHLKTMSHVKRIRLDERNPGITVVEFK